MIGRFSIQEGVERVNEEGERVEAIVLEELADPEPEDCNIEWVGETGEELNDNAD